MADEEDIENADLEEMIEALVFAGTAKLCTGALAVVTNYDDTTGKVPTCTAKPIMRAGIKGSSASLDMPAISNIPVLFPSGGGFSITWPLVKGDVVFLTFSDRSLDEWLEVGGSDINPQDKRRHALTDAVAIPAARPKSAPLVGSVAGALVIGQDAYSKTPIIDPKQFVLDGDGFSFTDGTVELLEDLQTFFGTVSTIPVASDPVSTQAAVNAILIAAGVMKGRIDPLVRP